MRSVNGWLNIDKPIGYTSSRIVITLKKLFKLNKIGHTGTLDPQASGVLPIAIGEATKLSNYLMDGEKAYSFTIQFGEQRDTGDSEGQVVNISNYLPSESECNEVVKNFIGEIRQTPHIYSAIKVNGKRAYDLARKGQQVDLKSRIISIKSLRLIEYNALYKQAKYEVKCSKGTYIRSLAEDMAKNLQTCGFVLELCRLQVGPFKISQAVKFEDLTVSKEFVSKLERIDKVLDGIPVLDIDDAIAYKIRYGQKVELKSSDKDLVWLRHNEILLTIGSIKSSLYYSNRVFNLL